jgi:hypothetical protein
MVFLPFKPHPKHTRADTFPRKFYALKRWLKLGRNSPDCGTFVVNFSDVCLFLKYCLRSWNGVSGSSGLGEKQSFYNLPKKVA